MKKRILAALLSAVLMLPVMMLAAAEEAEAPQKTPTPVITAAVYTSPAEDGDPETELEYTYPGSSEMTEVYILKKGITEPNMGTLEIGGEVYSIIGIQTPNPFAGDELTVSGDGKVKVRVNIYRGGCAAPAEGEEVYLAVGVYTGNGDEEALSDLIPFTAPPAGGTVDLLPEAQERK